MAISREKLEIIERLATLVREETGAEVPVGDIQEVVRRLGGTVVLNPSMDRFAPGRVVKTSESSFAISVSSLVSEERRRSAIAYALGVLLIPMGFLTSPDRWARAENADRRDIREGEGDANAFAGALLMPREEYYRQLMSHADHGIADMAAVAGYFHVTVSAARDRGMLLGYLRW